jgi:hypothetical protein
MAVIVAVVVLNVFVTVRITRDDLAEPVHRVAHIVLVWLVPIFGAFVVLHIQRKEPERNPHRYYASEEFSDDFRSSGGPRSGSIDGD